MRVWAWLNRDGKWYSQPEIQRILLACNSCQTRDVKPEVKWNFLFYFRNCRSWQYCCGLHSLQTIGKTTYFGVNFGTFLNLSQEFVILHVLLESERRALWGSAVISWWKVYRCLLRQGSSRAQLSPKTRLKHYFALQIYESYCKATTYFCFGRTW